LNKDVFSVTWELVPGRGAHEEAQENAIRSAEQAARDGRIHALTLTDNPGGKPAMSAAYLGLEIMKLGIEPLVHFTCKDKNRNQIESELYAMDRAGLRNVLVMSGDYPVNGFQGRPKPVFDLDSVHVMELIQQMNNGLPGESPRGSSQTPSDFFAGSVVSPFKATEAELMVQYYKLQKKIARGASFIVTQLGYDARKFHEVLQYTRMIDNEIPVIGNIYILPYGAAKMMNANQLPGSVVTDRLLQEIDAERSADDKGVNGRVLRAAKMYAFMKGMGFDGVHIGGHNLKYEQVTRIIDLGEELVPEWKRLISEFDYPQPDGFYYFVRDTENGLNTQVVVDRNRLAPNVPVNFNYRLMRMFHHIFFTPGKGAFPLMNRYYLAKQDPSKYPLEHLLKVIGNGCQDCGDCALLDLAYQCPAAQCPKNQRNGACGGSSNGWCEVFPNMKKCVWVTVYAMLKAYQEEGQLEQSYIPPVNWELYRTSAWYNYFTGRDHSRLNQPT